MTTKTDLELALKDALRASDDLRKRTIRMVMTNIKLAEVEKGSSLDQTGINTILQKEVKSRRESIADAERLNREDLITEAKAEIAILEDFLPQPLSSEEIKTLAKEVIAEIGATSPKEMGQVMKILVTRVQGRAPGGQVSQVVRELLTD